MIDPYQDIFDMRSESPLWWYNKSSDLHASAGALWVAISESNEKKYQKKLSLGSGFSMEVACWPVYQMLFGLSFELILKAIIVAQNSTPPPTHKLLDLAASTRIEIKKEEQDILVLLTESIIWEGKYPVPKQKSYLEGHYKKATEVLSKPYNVGNLEVKRFTHTLEWNNLDELWGKMVSHFFKYYKT